MTRRRTLMDVVEGLENSGDESSQGINIETSGTPGDDDYDGNNKPGKGGPALDEDEDDTLTLGDIQDEAD